MSYGRSGLALALSNQFPKYSVFQNMEIKDYLGFNFHKKEYADEVDNQRMFAPIQIQIAFDVAEIITRKRGIEVHYAWESLKKFTEQCLQAGSFIEVYFFNSEKIDRGI